MPEHERKEIIEAFKAVDRVILSSHKKNTKDISIAKNIKLSARIFAKGGDHLPAICRLRRCWFGNEIGCKIVNGIGYGGKVQKFIGISKKSAEK